MTVKEYQKIAYGEWFDYVDPADAKRAHARNVQRCRAAIKKHEAKDRKLHILLVHGSGRSSFKSLAHEFSNSQFLLKSAVRQLDRKSTRLNSSHLGISYAVFCLKKKK